MNGRIVLSIFILASLLLATPSPAQAQTQTPAPVVRAVLFFSPTCGHCQLVINETLLPMIEQYAGQLEIIGLDVTQPQGQAFFLAAMQKFGVEQAGVPFLVIGDRVLIGSLDIPEQFPGLVETCLAQGGVDWPDIPGLREAISQPSGADASTAAASTSQADAPAVTASVKPAATRTPLGPATVTPKAAAPGLIPADPHSGRWTETFALDPAGNTLAVIVLASMIGALAWGCRLFQKTKGASLKDNWSWAIPALCAIGIGVAGYLAYVETARVTAVCGPVGDCNTVQQSEYARLFGVLPVGILGLIGYAMILAAWSIARYANGSPADMAVLSLFAMTAFGTLFSIYLTFLEPFVIGATCAWCLTSAILMTILMLLSVRPAKLAFSKKPFAAPPPRRRTRIGAHDD